MRTRSFLLSLTMILAVTLTTTSCKKSKLTKELWYIDSATDLEDGSDITADYSGEIWEFAKDGNYNENSENKGTWAFSDDKERLVITKLDNSTDTYTIKSLSKKEMILEELGEEELTLKRYDN